jgi:hypothetical protein
MNCRTEAGLSKTEARRSGRDPDAGACIPDGARGVRFCLYDFAHTDEAQMRTFNK